MTDQPKGAQLILDAEVECIERLEAEFLERMEAEFLGRIWSDSPMPPEAQRARHATIRASVGDKALSPWSVTRLFYRLEQKAAAEIGKVLLLCQGIDGRGLPAALEANVSAIAEHHQTIGEKNASTKRQSRAAKARHEKETGALKAALREKCLEWRDKPHLYGTDSDFADLMKQQFPDASFDQVKRWVGEWRKAGEAPPPYRERLKQARGAK